MKAAVTTANNELEFKTSWREMIIKDFKANKYIYLILLPVVVYFLIFSYVPMYGITLAFKEYSVKLGIMGSPWVGMEYFQEFFNSPYFFRVLKNTLLISVYSMVLSFPAPIILALLLNEVRSKYFKKAVQTVTYLPHFISVVVICGMLTDFLATEGVINIVLGFFGVEATNWLAQKEAFRTIYVLSDIWQGVGWGSIVYLAALSGIDQELYEAATVDGANRWKQTLHVTIPGILPTIVIMLVLRLGSLLSVGFEKIILLQNGLNLETSEVISTFTYKKGLIDNQYSYSTAVGLFNSVINFVLLISANYFSRRLTETSLW
ncbi:MAG: ABC transporter permease [Cellulosilyticaceae bacterium]